MALDGPDVMEAVALDWEKVGIKVKRVPEATSSFRAEGTSRAEDRPDLHRCTARRRWDEPVAGWERALSLAKGALNLLLDGAYDEEVDVDGMREFDAERAREADARAWGRSSTTATTA